MPLRLDRLIRTMAGVRTRGEGALRGAGTCRGVAESRHGAWKCRSGSDPAQQRPRTSSPTSPRQWTLAAQEQVPRALGLCSAGAAGPLCVSLPHGSPAQHCGPVDESHRRAKKKALTSWQGSTAPNLSRAAELLVSCPRGGTSPGKQRQPLGGISCPAAPLAHPRRGAGVSAAQLPALARVLSSQEGPAHCCPRQLQLPHLFFPGTLLKLLIHWEKKQFLLA